MRIGFALMAALVLLFLDFRAINDIVNGNSNYLAQYAVLVLSVFAYLGMARLVIPQKRKS